jgi:ankyrin repeat protein
LDETYERVLREIKKPNREHALRLLQCLVVTTRPLRVSELAEVLAVDFDVEDGIPTLNTSWRWDDQEQTLLSSCPSLISIVHGDGNDGNDGNARVVQFSHFSVKEFLTSPRLAAPNRDVSHYYIGLEPAHMVMAQACLSVLLRSDDRVGDDGIGNNSPLASYAAKYWATHAQFKNVSSYLRQPMECLFDMDRPYFASWLRLHDIDSRPSYESPFFQITDHTGKSPASPMYYAALCGFRDLAERLIIKNPQGVKASGGYYMTPCVAALAGRYFELAHLLHRNGSSVNTRGRSGNSPLHSACHLGGYLEMIRILLEYGADVNAQNNGGATPLHFAAWSGLPEVVQVLLEQNADPNISRYDGMTPLHRAVQVRSATKVRLLLEHGADVDVVDKMGRSTLRYARERRYDEIVTLLLAHSTNVTS